ncbi:alpha/beta hydrolase fold protein [Hyaloraphidium curvatum]|nr:alpha/beta hydrolase fold protein [Hyaloraphidium curvatum]
MPHKAAAHSGALPDLKVAQTARGPVEFCEAGSGPPLLFVHGAPGGADQGMLMGKFLADAGFRVVAVSRPGYLGTPLSEANALPSQQADLWAALMDALDIEAAAVVCWSGGAPSSYRLAVQHPQKVKAIAVLAGVSRAYSWKGTLDEKLLSSAVGQGLIGLLAKVAPNSLIESTLAAQGDLPKKELHELAKHVESDPAKREFVLQLARTVVNRKVGLANDQKRFPEIGDLELDKIAAPVLLVHGDRDIDVDISYSRFAAEKIPGARLEVVPHGTHIAVFTDPNSASIQKIIVDFLGLHVQQKIL